MQDNEINEILTRGVEEIIEEDHLKEVLNSGKKLRIKLGIDPTAPDIHLGHSVVLRKLKQFQDFGHKIVLIIGDFTAQIGDPSGRNKTREPLTEKEIKKNMNGYLEQAGKIINIKKTEIHKNSEWHEKGGLKHILSIAKSSTIQQILRRDDFKKRMAEDSEISMLEMLYPILQGYDSVAIKADVEIGGTDQKFNLLMGRKIQRYFGMNEQDVMTLPLIEGTDGVKKMSKSYGNYIGISEDPKNMFGKLMSIPDKLIEKYFTLLTNENMKSDENPYTAKMRLAEIIVSEYHSEKDAIKTRDEWRRVFSNKETPSDLKELIVNKKDISLIELLILAGIESKSEARRLILQKAIQIDGQEKNDECVVSLKKGMILKIGKKKFLKIIV